MIKIKQAALLGSKDELPGHGMSQDWQLGKWPESFIDIMQVHKIASEDKIRNVSFDEIASKPYTPPLPSNSKGHKRYSDSDINYPCYLVEMENPYSKRYRMIDGRRRLYKMKEAGQVSGQFIVFKFTDIHPYIWNVIRLNNLEALEEKLK